MLAGWPGLVKKQGLEGFGCGFFAEESMEGLRPACLTQVRICEPGAPLQGCGTRKFGFLGEFLYFTISEYTYF
jgi:hypothetical protein